MLGNFLTSRWLPRALALGTITIILGMLNLDLEGDHFWALSSILALTLVSEFLAYQAGVAQGFLIYNSLTPEQRAEVNRILEEE
jgi:hypothetical protein